MFCCQYFMYKWNKEVGIIVDIVEAMHLPLRCDLERVEDICCCILKPDLL